MLSHLYFQQQLLRERRQQLSAVMDTPRWKVVRPAHDHRARNVTRALGARVLRIPAPTRLQHGC